MWGGVGEWVCVLLGYTYVCDMGVLWVCSVVWRCVCVCSNGVSVVWV